MLPYLCRVHIFEVVELGMPCGHDLGTDQGGQLRGNEADVMLHPLHRGRAQGADQVPVGQNQLWPAGHLTGFVQDSGQGDPFDPLGPGLLEQSLLFGGVQIVNHRGEADHRLNRLPVQSRAEVGPGLHLHDSQPRAEKPADITRIHLLVRLVHGPARDQDQGFESIRFLGPQMIQDRAEDLEVGNAGQIKGYFMGHELLCCASGLLS